MKRQCKLIIWRQGIIYMWNKLYFPTQGNVQWAKRGYITERCCFRLNDDGPRLIKLAP